MNIILPSSTYKSLQLYSLISRRVPQILAQISGVEPRPFVGRPVIDWPTLQLKPQRVAKFLQTYINHRMPLTNGTHGIRLHGLTDFDFQFNRINYAQESKTSLALIADQIDLTSQLAQIGQVDDQKYPSILTLHIGHSRGDKKAELARLAQVINEIAPLTQAKRVIINFESLPRFANGYYELGSDLNDFGEFFSQLKSLDSVGLTFDLAHSLVCYYGDYQKIKADLIKNNLLPLINYLHITVPAIGYLARPIALGRQHRFFIADILSILLFYQGDNHAGLLGQPVEEKEKWLDLVDFLVKNSKVADSRFNVVNLELGTKIWGTSKGATVKDVDYTLTRVKQRLGLTVEPSNN
ncbi:MAG: TIM barrel protein [Patescibacteria group bacterium]